MCDTVWCGGQRVTSGVIPTSYLVRDRVFLAFSAVFKLACEALGFSCLCPLALLQELWADRNECNRHECDVVWLWILEIQTQVFTLAWGHLPSPVFPFLFQGVRESLAPENRPGCSWYSASSCWMNGYCVLYRS